ncbi:WS/DGAT domain-containing protein (plasmid) [Rhodococcus sp. JS3073]|nr:WS/DGAT domain-containing protein [Rhodococcus sp. JS3073]
MLEPVRRFVDGNSAPVQRADFLHSRPEKTPVLERCPPDAVCPAAAVLGGQALSITVTSRAGQLEVGVVGDRSAVPHPQRIITHLETSLTDLEHPLAPRGR